MDAVAVTTGYDAAAERKLIRDRVDKASDFGRAAAHADAVSRDG